MFSIFRKKPQPEPRIEPAVSRSFFSTDISASVGSGLATEKAKNAELLAQQPAASIGMDDGTGLQTLKALTSAQGAMPDSQAMWYMSQHFIGYQMCAHLAQHWLINRACTLPARDATRKGFEVVAEDGDEISDEALKMLKRADKKHRIHKRAEEFVRKGRIFGVRIALFHVNSDDPEYYEKPFNPDGVKPGTYKGITQVDPYWCAPSLEGDSITSPISQHFYEPTYWVISGKKVHRSHLVIFRNAEPVDIFKPMYLYGGIPVPQLIAERVYAAERVANEAPMLAVSKRTSVWKTDMEDVAANADTVVQRLQAWVAQRDNYGIKLGDTNDEFQQFDTSLSDFDSVLFGQYQLVAAASGVPVVKLLGMSPKGGLNGAGSYEESSYHEELSSIQEHDLTPLIERHHLLVWRSEIKPKLGELVNTTINWMPLDEQTAEDLARVNMIKAQTGALLIQAGAIDSEIERQRVATDPSGGYHTLGLSEEPEPDDFEPDYPPSPSKQEQEPDNGEGGEGENQIHVKGVRKIRVM